MTGIGVKVAPEFWELTAPLRLTASPTTYDVLDCMSLDKEKIAAIQLQVTLYAGSVPDIIANIEKHKRTQ